MNESLQIALKMLAVGMLLGIVFFGGLWLTLKRLPSSVSPHLLVLLSALVRTIAVVFGLWYFSNGTPLGIVSGLAGFVALQRVAVRRGLSVTHHSNGKSSNE